MGRSCHSDAVHSNRLTRRILYSELQQELATGGQKKRFPDQLKATLRKCSVPPAQLETLAADREEWRGVCDEGSGVFDINYDHSSRKRFFGFFLKIRKKT